MIYFIGNKQQDIVKIGYTQNSIQQRICTIQANSPYKMEVFGIVEGMKNIEQFIHDKFKHLHIRGEWYRISEEMLLWIEKPILPYIEETFISTRILSKDDNIIEQLYSQNLSIRQIALETGFTFSQVRTFVTRRNLNTKYKEIRRKSPGNHNRGIKKHKTPKTKNIEML